MSMTKLETEFNELVARISESELQRNKKVTRCIEDIRRAIGRLKNSSPPKALDRIEIGTIDGRRPKVRICKQVASIVETWRDREWIIAIEPSTK